MWEGITYPFPNFNGYTIEVWEWISNFIPHFTGQMITYPCWDLNYFMSVKGATGLLITGKFLQSQCNSSNCTDLILPNYSGLSTRRPVGCQAITWTTAALDCWLKGTNCSDIWTKITQFFIQGNAFENFFWHFIDASMSRQLQALW